MKGRTCITLLIGLAIFAGVGLAQRDTAFAPERMIITGLPPFGPTQLLAEDGTLIPAGCGPEAARILLSYYDRRYGYRFVRDDPDGAIRELYRRMGTTTIIWKGKRQGLTWPWAFASGLEAYITARYPGGVVLGSAYAELAPAFARSVELIRQGVPHVILFDWQGAGGIFPTHYAVVVGYDMSQGRRFLVLNPGWGYDFQLLDMTDSEVAPVILFWIEEVRDPPDVQPGSSVGPRSAAGMWEVDQEGRVQLRPILHLHNDPQSTIRWPASSHVQFLVPSVDDLAIVTWFSASPGHTK